MNKLNVFNNPYYKWYYPQYWHKNIRMFFRSIKYAYQRITRGWADCDTWDLDSYYLDLFHDTLTYLAEHHMGYPGNDEFDTDEKWTAYLKEMAQKFYQANESNEYYDTPEADKWWEWIQQHPATWKKEKVGNIELSRHIREDGPYDKSMMEEDRFLSYLRHKDMEHGLDMLKHVYFNLWD